MTSTVMNWNMASSTTNHFLLNPQFHLFPQPNERANTPLSNLLLLHVRPAAAGTNGSTWTLADVLAWRRALVALMCVSKVLVGPQTWDAVRCPATWGWTLIRERQCSPIGECVLVADEEGRCLREAPTAARPAVAIIWVPGNYVVLPNCCCD